MDIFESRMCVFVKNVEFSYFNRILNCIDIKILEHGHLKAGSEWRFGDLSSPFNRLYFVISGSAKIKNKNNDILMKPGNAYLTPLYESFNYECEKYIEKFYIHFRMEIIPGHDVFVGQKECLEIPAKMDDVNSLIRIGNSVDDYITDDAEGKSDLGSMIMCKGILMQYIGGLISKTNVNINEQISFSGKYYTVYDYIQNNCVASLRVQDIADHLNISISNLSKSFKNDTGLTLKRYIEDKIVARAQEMLLVTNRTVKDVATRLEFSDEYHFSRFFKNRTGISPSKYRQRSNTYK